LHELSVSTSLSSFASPYRTEVISFEWRSQFLDVLGGESSQWNSQVKSHADMPASVILKPIQLAIGFFATFASENFKVFKRRGVNWSETKRLKD
jgi:hypothetical protein